MQKVVALQASMNFSSSRFVSFGAFRGESFSVLSVCSVVCALLFLLAADYWLLLVFPPHCRDGGPQRLV